MMHKLLVDGKWVGTKEVSRVVNPFDGTLVGEVCQAGKPEIESAISSATKAFELTRKLPAYRREDILLRVATQLRDRKDEIARTMTLESGKPIQFTASEVDRAVLTFGLAAEESKRLPGDVVPLDLAGGSEGRWGIVRRFPIGPVTSITPFNFPLNLVAHKVAPAIAAGNSVVHKAPPQTPITSFLLAEMLLNAGMPDGAVNVVSCDNDLAEQIVVDPRMRILSFTGSPRVGWYLKSKVPKKGHTRTRRKRSRDCRRGR